MLRLIAAVLVSLALACTTATAQVQPSSPVTSKSYVDGQVQTLLNALTSKAPLANPSFTGTVTAPSFAVSGSASTGNVSGMSTVATGGTVARTFADRFGETVQLSDFGWDKTGATDCGPALRAAGAKLAGTGGRIRIGTGTCWINSAVVYTKAVEIEGQGWQEGPGIAGGTWLKVTDPSIQPITFSGGNARGSGVFGLAVWQQQPNPAVGWAPTDYPAVITVKDTLGTSNFDNLLFAGVTRGIDVQNAGRVNIGTLKGQWYKYGVQMDDVLDVPRIGYMHGWTFVTSDVNVTKYMAANLDLLVLKRADGIFVNNIFGFAANSVARLTAGTNGVTTQAWFGKVSADFSRYGLLVDSAGSTVQVGYGESSNNTFGDASTPLTGGAAIKVTGANTVVDVGGWFARFAESSPFQLLSTGGRINMSSMQVLEANTKQDGSPIVNLADSGAGTPNSFYLAHAPNLSSVHGAPLRNVSNGYFAQAVFNEVAGAQANEVRTYGAGTGGAPTVAAIGSDTNVSLTLLGKGLAGVSLKAGARTLFRTDNASSGDTNILVRPVVGGTTMGLESDSTNANFTLASKGTGSVVVQGNGGTIARFDNPASGNASLLGRSGTGVFSFNVEGGATNADLNVTAKGAGTVGFGSQPKFFAGNTTGTASAALGANSPATTPSAPYTWITAKAADGTTVYVPAWK